MCTRGDSWKAAAIQEENKTIWFNFEKQRKYEKVGDLFEKAGNAYKVSQQWEDAGAMFLNAANACSVCSSYQVVGHLTESAQCYGMGGNHQQSINIWRKVVDVCIQQGDFKKAAKYVNAIAEIYVKVDEVEQAAIAYQDASDLFVKCHSLFDSNACLLKMADLLSVSGTDIVRASQIYEQLGKVSMTQYSFSAKDYFFNCLLCHLALGDYINTRLKLESFCNLCFALSKSLQSNFIENLLTACEKMDREAFTTHCFEFDLVSPLDPKKTNLLLKCKRSIPDMDPDSSMNPGINSGMNSEHIDLS